jgi:predicted NBD/HSP70 family sugar kinase
VGRAREGRWSTAADALRLLRREPDLTRTDLARRLGLSSGTATDLVARLRERRLVAEDPAPAAGRGRPTTLLRAHPDGPLLLAVDLRPGGWTAVVAGLDGTFVECARGPHDRDARVVVDRIRRAVAAARHRHGPRLRAVSVAVAGTVAGSRVGQAGVLGWAGVDLAPVAGRLPLLVGNDATLAAVAEAGHGAARDARTALHLFVDAGIGGALTIDGRPVTGRGGAAGEYGHLPFGDPDAACACGAYGCWETDLRGPDVPAALGRGTAGLVNAVDPDVVTLGGRAGALVAEPEPDAAFHAAYLRGLMALHRAAPPPVVAAAFGADGPLRGAIDTGLEHLTRPESLAAWSGAAGDG